jgi:RES domain-containing protein
LSRVLLEVLVPLEVDQEDFPDSLQLLRVDIPEDVALAEMPALQTGWQLKPAHTRSVGNAFLRATAALLLPVPSVVMPHTVNYLFNPMHPDAGRATVTTDVFSRDARLIRH